jgi:hypothetical protein
MPKHEDTPAVLRLENSGSNFITNRLHRVEQRRCFVLFALGVGVEKSELELGGL